MTLDHVGASIYVADRGAGVAPPVLLLHGNPDSADLWDGILDHLAPRRRCLAPDLPGFGRSGVPVDFDPSLAGLARFVDQLLDEIGLDGPVDLVAHDLGGLFGLAWAITHPERVRRLVVGGCPFHGDYRWHAWARLWRTPLLGELSLLGMNRWLFRRELRRGGPGLSDAHIAASYRHVTSAAKRMVLRLYRAADPSVYAAWEPRLLALTAQVPTLVLWGAHDPYIPVRYADRFGATQTASGRVHVFPDCGHWWPAEQAEASAALIEAFFDEEKNG
ncbi:MAG: alpha/beta hydrolase [Bacteroidota bacterium]